MSPNITLNARILAGLVLLLGLTGVTVAQTAPTTIMEAIQQGDYSQLSPEMRAAVASAQASARVAANLDRAPSSVIQSSIRQSARMQQQAREAYVAALPPRDREIGASVMLGDDTRHGSRGKLYYFVSRSMPLSLLRAYALESLYTGGTLVMKGVRKGDTIKEYLEEVVEDYNNAEGQVLSGMELNPNLFDMFGVTVVPTTVWTNRMGLDDVGSGCENLPEGAPVPKVTLPGPDDRPITVDAPVCAPAPETSYYKIAGALSLNYVLDRFQDAGAPKRAMNYYRSLLAERHSDVNDGTQTAVGTGNAMTPIPHDLRLDSLPRVVLAHWQDELAQKNVQRGPYGPVFSSDMDDDADYRRELLAKIEHGLGL